MHDIALDLLILLGGIWVVAVTLRPLGLPTVMGELIVGVLVGPAVFGLIEPSEAIQLLAEIGIFFLMFHSGVETQPVQFFDALKRSLGVAIVGAIVPFSVSFGVSTLFGLDWVSATFVGLTMTATAVVITLKSLRDLGLANTRVARIIVASCVIDDLLTLVFFGLVVGVLSGGTFEPSAILITLGKVLGFFAVSIVIGRYVYPRLRLPFRSEGGKGFTFVLVTAFAAGLFAEIIGLHMILGAYVAGLFFEQSVAHPNLVSIVLDRAYGIAYSFLGPIFFMTLGFSITFDIDITGVAFLATLTVTVIIGQIVSAGAMARRMGLPIREALTVGVGMCGRAEMAFILASLALAQGAIDSTNFSVLIFTAFLLNLFTPLALKGCAVLLKGEAARVGDATRGVLLIDKFAVGDLTVGRWEGPLPKTFPNLEDAVVIYGYGPEVDSLLEELQNRELLAVVIEEDEDSARRLLERNVQVVCGSASDEKLDMAPVTKARALVANGSDDANAVFAMRAREEGFTGPIVALIHSPLRRAPIVLAGATTAFTPTHVLAAVIAQRASTRIGPRIAGLRPLGQHLEVTELRIHEKSPLANSTLAKAEIRTVTGTNIVGQWSDDTLKSPPAPDEELEPGTILIAAGTPDNIRRLSELSRPIPSDGPFVIVGYQDVGEELRAILTDVGEEVSVVDAEDKPGVDIVGEVLDRSVLEQASITEARGTILALENDSSTQLAATVIRKFAPEVPLIASVERLENVERIQRAGADYAVSVGQVAGQILAHHVLGETVSIQPRIKLVKVRPGPLEGRNPLAAKVRERTSCTVVAVERGQEIITDFPESFVLASDDAIYVCGTTNAVQRYYDEFSTVRL